MKTSTEQDYHQRIVRTLVHIQDHLDDALELETVASVAAFSPFHFHRIFRGLIGESFKAYVRRLRLERAARNLKLTDDAVTRIALDAGFETHESFTRAFTAMFGASPSAYRAAHKPFPQSPSGAHFDDIVSYHFPDYGGAPEVEVHRLPAMRLVFLRHVGPYSQVGAAWGRLMSWAGTRGLFGSNTKMIGIVHDDPDVTPPKGAFSAQQSAFSALAAAEPRFIEPVTSAPRRPR